MKHLVAIINLTLRFAWAVFVSGLQTTALILKGSLPGRKPVLGTLIRVRFAPMSEKGAALLGAMVSLTPGTTTIEIDLDKHELLLHVLDSSDPGAVVEAIRRDFEPGVKVLFGTEISQ